MQPFDLIAVLIVLTAALSYLNYRFLKLPTTIGLMALTLLASLAILGAGLLFSPVAHQVRAFVRQIDFSQALLHGMLGFLIFAGALHVNLNDLDRHKVVIGLLATVGVVLSTAIVGALTWWLSSGLVLGLRPIDCFLFGGPHLPHGPIAVLSLLKRIGAPKDLEVTIAGESLLNDGVGVAIFLGLLEASTAGHPVDPLRLTEVFLEEALGGVAFGLVLGLVTYWLLKSIENYQVEVLLTLALVTGGYALADPLPVSAPIAMVAAGLLIGNHGRRFAMGLTTCRNLTLFWELIDEILNAILFVLIGLEVFVVRFQGRYLTAGLLVIPVVLLARWLSVALPIWGLRRWRPFNPAAIRVLTWGGLQEGSRWPWPFRCPTSQAPNPTTRET